VDLSAVPEVRRLSGGVSNPTYLLRYPDGDLVLRRPPKGAHHRGAHDMGREHRIQTELGRVLPYVPRTVALCADAAVIGTPFSVMQRLDGPIPRKDLPPGVELSREQVAQLCRNVVDLLVGLHSFDVTEAGLAELGKGPGFLRRQVESWTGRYRRARTWNVGSFEGVTRRPADDQPAARPHNDGPPERRDGARGRGPGNVTIRTSARSPGT
jgi:aminoglycoside phosphotransferase (APT) family kinase protein